MKGEVVVWALGILETIGAAATKLEEGGAGAIAVGAGAIDVMVEVAAAEWWWLYV